MRSLPKLLFCAVILLLACCHQRGNASEDQAKRPNVVVFLADDAGWGDYGHSGNHQVRTPHIDSIAEQGVSLEHFYVCPLCAPTRAEFLTGRYYPRTDVRGVSSGDERLNPSEKTIADAFHAAGYATGAFGKWHNGTQWPYHPMARGFDEYFGHSAGHWGEYFNAPLEDNGRMVKTEGYIVDVCTDRALDFIERHHEQPFFCYIPFTTPHSPWAAPEEDWGRFRDKPIEQRATRPKQEDLDQTRCALAMLENQDRNVGRVLGLLERHGLSDDTIVVYFSDNGPNSWRFNGGMKGRKGGIDEGGVRSVGYLRYPKQLPAGGSVSEIAGAIDLLPTLASLAGIKRVGDKPLDGLDLSPLLRGESVNWQERFLFSTWRGQVSARSQRYRLDNAGNLYDMEQDLGQTIPVQQERAQIAEEMQNAVTAWRKDVLEPADERNRLAEKHAKNVIGSWQSKKLDPRPFPVGYEQFPVTMLPARDAEAFGAVRRSAPAPNCSYFVNWTATDDRIVWFVDVQHAGRYSVAIDYTCPLDDVGSTIKLSGGDNELVGTVSKGFDPPLNTNQDTLPRPDGESQMKAFASLPLGEIELDAGQYPLILQATDIPGNSVMDVRRLTLTLVK